MAETDSNAGRADTARVVSIRMTGALKRRVVVRSRAQGSTLSAYVVEAVERRLDAEEGVA